MKQIVVFIIFLSCCHHGTSANFIQRFKANSCEGVNFPKPPCCGIGGKNSARIVNGTKVDLNEFPWMVYIGGCGGSLINSQWVLTAAHCILLSSPQWAYFGAQDCRNKQCSKYEKKIQIRERFAPKAPLDLYLKHLYFDIALLQLEEAVTFSDAIRPICLPTKVDQDLAGSKAIVSGWGYTNSRGVSPDLLKTIIEIWDSKICEEFTNYGTILNSTSQICAGGKSNNACSGDSGGPLFLKSNDKENSEYFYQVGIVSYGLSMDSCITHLRHGFPQIYTKVINYIKWIETTILENQ